MGIALFRQHGERLDPGDRRRLGAAAGMLSNTIAAAAWVRDRSARLPAAQGRAPAPAGDRALDAVNAASASTAEPPPIASSAGTLLDRDGVAGSRQRLDEIEQRRRALTALNEQEFAGNPARLRANRAAIGADTARSRAEAKAESDKVYADLQVHMTTGGPGGGPAVSDEDFAALEKLQTAVRSNDGGAERGCLQIVIRMVNRALRTAGIDPTPSSDGTLDSDAAQAATFRRALQDDLTALERAGSRLATR